MNSYQRMLSLVRHIYTAAADETRWPDVLERLADEYRGGVSGFHLRVGTEGYVRSARFVRIDPALRDAILTHYAARNPWVRLTQPLLSPGDVLALDQLMPLSELRRTEYHDGILKPLGLSHCFGACLSKRGDDILTFTVVRSQARGPYEAWELNQVRPLLPHLRRAVQVNERLSELERTQVALADSLESLRQGVVVINQRGKVFFANRAAREIVARRDGLAITADGLVPSNYADRVRLRSLLDETVQSSIGAGCSPGGAMAVARPSSKPAFLVLVAPLPLELGEGHPQGLATVFISDPDAREETAGERARRVYGLSPSEARVAQAFAATGSLALVADQLRISRGTARWHLKRIYSKTGVHRQADLLRRLARDPGRLVGETGPDDDPLSARQ